MKVLGIDPGSRVTGYGLVAKGSGGKLTHLFNGEIKTNAKAPLADKLFTISSALIKVIEEHSPDVVAVESLFYSKNVKSTITMAHARGVVFNEAARAGLSVFEYSPTTVKQALTGYGSATKEQVQKMVTMLLSIDEVSGMDASDALAVAICHINHEGALTAN